MPYRQTMAPKKRSFKDAFEGAFNTILDVHEKQLNKKNFRADLVKKALEKRIHNLQEEIKKLQEQACKAQFRLTKTLLRLTKHARPRSALVL